MPAPVWVGVVLSLAGLLLLSGAPGGSWAGNLLVLGNAVAQSLQIVAMERFAPRYDARALTFLQMTVAFAGFTVVAVATGQVEAPPDAQTWYAARRHRCLRRGARVPRRDLGAVADDGGARGARLHARGPVRGPLRRAPPLRDARLGRLARAAR